MLQTFKMGIIYVTVRKHDMIFIRWEKKLSFTLLYIIVHNAIVFLLKNIMTLRIDVYINYKDLKLTLILKSLNCKVGDN